MKAKSLKMFVAAFISLFAFTATMPAFAQTTGGGGKPQQALVIAGSNECGITANNSPGGLGVTVTQVTPGKPCGDAGIEVGDIIIAVNNHAISTLRQLNDALLSAHGDVPFIVQDVSTGDIFQIVVTLP
ncbi:PDZ domain-containing protein [Nitrosomonas sp. Nm34]|uniref:PDZ domain-containing protein n=1 Tax=Nitrosomonas sp. Nm34 TaxID=1881055 RepID=UPI0008E3E210|nr:PDZ domain-containing protein [Nitrosomonas sp. Nm34]SFJ13444.1 PDZ domain-containing protein [Nitrosomonas sp. Nm34]